MKKLFLFLFLVSAPAYADITSKFTSSVSVKVDAAMTQATQLVHHIVHLEAISEQSDSNDQIGGLTVNSDGGYS